MEEMKLSRGGLQAAVIMVIGLFLTAVQHPTFPGMSAAGIDYMTGKITLAAMIALVACHFGPPNFRRFAAIPAALGLICALLMIAFATREASSAMDSMAAFAGRRSGMPLTATISRFWGVGMYVVLLGSAGLAYELRRYYQLFRTDAQ